jgi:hypothetical protein
MAGGILLLCSLAACATPVEPSGPASDAAPLPLQRTFGPAFAPAPPIADRVRIFGALLARDRRSITVSFIGGKPYRASDSCSTDYEGWAGVDGDTLAVVVAKVAHPEQVQGGEGAVCSSGGHGYLFTLLLPAAFPGRTVTDLTSGPLWVPPPDAVAELTVGAADWQLTGVTAEPTLAELSRMYQPRPGVPGDPGRFIALHQAFRGPASNVVDAPVARGVIHGKDVPIGRNGVGFAAAWASGSNHFWFTVEDAAVTLDDFIAMANGVQVPAP